MSKQSYDEKYLADFYYWGREPSETAYKVLRMKKPVRPWKLFVVECGEGWNTIFFARNGYEVSAFDLSERGIEKNKRYAEEAGVTINAFTADINEYRLEKDYDFLFSTGALHYIPEELRTEIFRNYKNNTNEGGLHVFSVFVDKPFIGPAPDEEESSRSWISGELMTYYGDVMVEWWTEKLFDGNSGGAEHRHVMDRIAARGV